MVIDPQTVLTVSGNWGRWAVKRRQWREAVEAYDFGLVIGRKLLAQQLERAHKDSWLGVLQHLAAPAAYARAQLGAVEEAAITIECGRARLLAEALERVCIETVESGQMTKDLALLVGPDTPWLNTQEFLDALDENLKKAMAS